MGVKTDLQAATGVQTRAVHRPVSSVFSGWTDTDMRYTSSQSQSVVLHHTTNSYSSLLRSDGWRVSRPKERKAREWRRRTTCRHRAVHRHIATLASSAVSKLRLVHPVIIRSRVAVKLDRKGMCAEDWSTMTLSGGR